MTSKLYKKNKKGIYKWRETHREHHKENQRKYQSKYRIWLKAKKEFLKILINE